MFRQLDITTDGAPTSLEIPCVLNARLAEFQDISGKITVLAHRETDGEVAVEVDGVSLSNASQTVRIERRSDRPPVLKRFSAASLWVHVNASVTVARLGVAVETCTATFTISEASDGSHSAKVYVRDPHDPKLKL